MTEQDQKPTLDYRKPSPPPKDWKIDLTICIAFATVGAACLLVTALWIWQMLRFEDIRGVFTDNASGFTLIPILGLILLFVAWRIRKRMKCD